MRTRRDPISGAGCSSALVGIPVRPFGAEGETVTPTGIALLKAFGAEFGPWPQMVIEKLKPCMDVCL
ncbi:MAG: nickel insertion protein [Parasutterella excrementihominis]